MRRAALAAALMVLGLAGRVSAQPAATIENLREKAVITDEDRRQIGNWVADTVNAMITNTDVDRRGMVAARGNLLNEGRKEATRSPAFLQAFGDAVVEAIKEADKRAITPESRVNLFIVLAELRPLGGVPILRTAIERDPYPASRYWAAKGLANVADVVVEKAETRVEADIADSIAKVLDTETSVATLGHLFDTLKRFDHERAHDVLTDGIGKVVARVSASDALGAAMYGNAIRALEPAYSREMRPEAKTRVLTAYAVLCVGIMPPVADANLMATLNASLEKITGEKVGFVATDDPVMQKMSLLDWVERFVKDKRIPSRPALPPAVEAALKNLKEAAATSGGAEPTP